MGRLCAQPKHSSGGAYNNNFKRQKTYNNNYQARNGNEQHQPGRGYQYQQPNAGFDRNKFCELHNKIGHDLAGCNKMKKQAAKMRAQWMTLKRAGGQGDCPHYYQKNDDKNLHAMVQQMVDDSLKQKSKRKAGGVHFASEVAMIPVKKEDDDDDEDNIVSREKDDELDNFNKMQLKSIQDDDSGDDEDIYN
jgi:hypothetical protein